jgi:predicted RNA-binding protein
LPDYAVNRDDSKQQEENMNYWIFTVTNQKFENKVYSARDIYVQRMKDEFWGLGEKTPNRSKIQAGDKIIFYVGIPLRVFAGTAIAASPNFRLSAQEIEKYSHDMPIYETEYGIKLTDIDIWEVPKFVPGLVDAIQFIENKEYWGTYFQGGVRGITIHDYDVILSAKPDIPLSTIIEADEILETTKQFALEAHLEEFLHVNWSKIYWGNSLRLYDTPEGDGRQFPAGIWSIDFLAVDNETNDLVVIELKRGQSSDTTVGQVLRYIGWVKENIATTGQRVRGIIICHEIDDALGYAVRQIENVDVLTYKVNFELQPMTAKA